MTVTVRSLAGLTLAFVAISFSLQGDLTGLLPAIAPSPCSDYFEAALRDDWSRYRDLRLSENP